MSKTKRSASQTGKLAKHRGSSFELEIARLLEMELGIKFQRNLEQVRTAGHSDLVASDPTFPFSLELKRRRTGNHIPAGAWRQAQEASSKDDALFPCVIYRYDRLLPRAVVPFAAIVEAETGHKTNNMDDQADLSFPAFCKLTRELLAWRAERTGHDKGHDKDVFGTEA